MNLLHSFQEGSCAFINWPVPSPPNSQYIEVKNGKGLKFCIELVLSI